MKIIVGLGNPGDNYSSTKHNAGFWIVDSMVEQSSLKYKNGKGDFIYAKNQQCLFVKPTTFVNNSGCLLYTSPSPRDGLLSRMPSSA